jgi:hypothetical protein
MILNIVGHGFEFKIELVKIKFSNMRSELISGLIFESKASFKSYLNKCMVTLKMKAGVVVPFSTILSLSLAWYQGRLDSNP